MNPFIDPLGNRIHFPGLEGAGLDGEIESSGDASSEEDEEGVPNRPLEWSIDTLSHMAAVGDADGLSRPSELPMKVEAEDVAHVAADEARAEQYWADGRGPASLITPAKARTSTAQLPYETSPTLRRELRNNDRGAAEMEAFLPTSLQGATTPSPTISRDKNQDGSSSSMVDSFRQWHSQQVQSLSPQQIAPATCEPLPADPTTTSPYQQQPIYSANNTPFGSAKKPPRTPVPRTLPLSQPRSQANAVNASHPNAATPVRPAGGSPGGLFAGFGGVSPIPTSNFKEDAAVEAASYGAAENPIAGGVATPAREKGAASSDDPFALGLRPLTAESPLLAASPLMPAERVFWSPGGGRVHGGSPPRNENGYGGAVLPKGSDISFRFGGGGGGNSTSVSLSKSAAPGEGQGWGTPPAIHSSWAKESSDWLSGSLSYSSGGGSSSDRSPKAFDVEEGQEGGHDAGDMHEDFPPSPPHSIRSRRPRVNRSLFDGDDNVLDANESGHARNLSLHGRHDSRSLHSLSLLESFTAVADERPTNSSTSLDSLSLLADTSYVTASTGVLAAGSVTRSRGCDDKRSTKGEAEGAMPVRSCDQEPMEDAVQGASDANIHQNGQDEGQDGVSSPPPALNSKDSPSLQPPHSIQTAKLVQSRDASLDAPHRWQKPVETPSQPPLSSRLPPPPPWSGEPVTPPRYALTEAHRKVPMSAESLPLRKACRYFREKYGAQTPPPSQRYGRSRSSGSPRGSVSKSKPSFLLDPPAISHRRRSPQWASGLPREPHPFGFVSFDYG